MKVRAGIAIIVVSFCLGLMCHQAVIGASSEEQAALESAGAWLALVDAGEYGKSWDEAASFFKGRLSKDQWEKALPTVRKPLGKVISRATGSAMYSKAVPGAPDGQYVVIQYNTSFENKKSAVETVTPMLDKDGKWRVSGYFIK